jgi:hypothetical protein
MAVYIENVMDFFTSINRIVGMHNHELLINFQFMILYWTAGFQPAPR